MALTNALRPLRLPALPVDLSLDRFLERWHGALTACLPAPLRRRFGPQDRHLTLVLQGEDAILYRETGDARETLGEIGGDASNTALAALVSETKKGNRGRVLIELPSELVISRTVFFPIQVRKDLAKVVAYEIDRLTPFRPDQVYFDFRPLDVQSKSDKIAVRIALCRRDPVQIWVDRLHEAGAPAEEIAWEGAWPRANLLPSVERPRRRGNLLSATRLLLLLVVLLTVAALIGPIWQKNRFLRELDQEVESLKVQAEEVYDVRSAIEQARQGSVAVLERKSEQPRMIDLLRELTDRLPDGTWVQNLDYREGEVQIRGESPQAATLIGLLEKAPGFEEVGFRSSVVQVGATGQERFHIGFRYTRVDEQP